MAQLKQEVLERLNSAKIDGGGNVTYIYENGTKQRQPINQAIFYNEKKKEKHFEEVIGVFTSTMNDLGAVDFEL